MKKKFIMALLLILASPWSFSQSLDDYFKMAAENNPGLQAQYKEYEAALQKVPQANALPDPVFSFGYFISPAETRVGPQQAKFSLNQMFPWFGSLKAQGDAAALMAEAKFQAFIDARNSLGFQVAAAYYPLYELDAWKKIEMENISILETYKAIATKKYETGYGTMVDLLRVDILLNDAKTNLNILQDKENALLASFNSLLNRPAEERVEIPDLLGIESIPFYFQADSVLFDHPVLKSLDFKIQAARAGGLAARKQGMPKMGIGLDYIVVGKRNDVTMADNGRDIFMPMINLSIPIFRKKYNASIKEAQLMSESYALQKEDYTNTLITNYQTAGFELQQQLRLISLYERQIQTSRQSLNLLLTAYGNSDQEFEEVLRMQQQVLKYQKMMASALAQYHMAWAKIHYLTAKNDSYENNPE